MEHSLKGAERVIAIVTLLSADYEFRSLSEICKELKISKSTAHRILTSLENLQWVTRDSNTRRYRLGNRALEFGYSMISHFDIESISLPYLYQLRDTTGETTMLSLRVGLERVYIEQISGKHEVRQIVELGKRYPLWNGAPGEAILAYLEGNEIEQVMDSLRASGMKSLASGQPITIDSLRNELKEIRKRGFAASFGKRIVGVGAVAAPIFGSNHRVTGAISIGGPIERFNRNNIGRYGSLVRRATREIGTQLGDFSDKDNTQI